MRSRFTHIFIVLFVLFAYIGTAQTNYYIMKSRGISDDYEFTSQGTLLIKGNAQGVKDALSAEQPLPFKFTLYGKGYWTYRASNNGYITFDVDTYINFPNNTNLPDTKAPKSAIFGFWDALTLVAPDQNYRYEVVAWTYGDAPNRVHVIQWFQIRKDLETSSLHTFAIRLYESGKFDVVFNLYFKGSGIESTTTGTIGCQNEDGTKGIAVNGSPNIAFPTDITSGDKSSFIVYEFNYGTQPNYDVTTISLDLPKYVKNNTQVPITGKLRNLGSETIKNLKLNYTIDDGLVVSRQITDLNIESGEIYTFTHPTPWTVPATEKNYTIEAWASDINGQKDENDKNDKVKATVTASSSMVTRKPLFEVFTSSTCPPCKPGNEKLTSVLNQYPNKWTVVKYQYYFPGVGDPYCTAECLDRGTYYGGINSVPRLQIDGQWNDNPNSMTTDLFNQFYNQPCFVTIKGQAKIEGQTVDLSGSVESGIDLTGTQTLFLAVVEKTTVKNVATNGETEFQYVMKKMLPNANGTNVGTMIKGKPYSFSQKFTFPGTYRLPVNTADSIKIYSEHSVEEFNDLTVVMWLQNDQTKEIYQSEFSQVITSVDDYSNTFLVNLYPNPVTTAGTIRFNLDIPELVSFNIVNNLGQIVYSSNASLLTPGTHTIDFDATTLWSGAYYMNLFIGDKVITRTFIK